MTVGKFRLSVLCLSLAILLGAGQSQSVQKNGLQITDRSMLSSVGSVEVSPDGNRILYTVRGGQGAGVSSGIYIMDVKSGEATKFMGNEGRGGSPKWSPDGKWISFSGRQGGESGLMIARPDGSDTRFLAEIKGTNHPLPSSRGRLAWSPDSKKIAFVSATPGPETEEASGDPVVITRYLYKPTASEGSTRFNDNRRVHIFVVDIESREIVQLTHGSYYEHSIDWSPDGREIAFVSNREPDPDRFFNYDLYAINVENRSVRAITQTENAEYEPKWSPDGKTVLYLGTKRGLTSSETTMEDTHVWLVNSDGTNRRELGGSIDNRQRSPGWSRDGKSVYTTVQDWGDVKLYRLSVENGRSELMLGERGRVGSWSTGKGSLIAYVFSAPKDMSQLYMKNGNTSRQLTDLNARFLAEKTVAEVEAFTFQSFDGLEVQAFLTKPLGINQDSKHPLIVSIHGGPHGMQGPTLNHKAQVYANEGWATLMVNYRGSTGYGQAFADAIFGDQNGGEAKDVLYGTEAAIRRHEWLDPNRVGVEGGSYGGQLTNWLITQTNRFSAAIPIAGISNLISFNYMAYYHDYLAVEFGALPHQENLMDLLWERSPLKYVANVRTPTMFVHGENDNDVPIAEAEQFFIALKDVGVETIMLRYPGEGHGIRQPRHVEDYINRSIAWYKKHFEEEGGMMPASSSVR